MYKIYLIDDKKGDGSKPFFEFVYPCIPVVGWKKEAGSSQTRRPIEVTSVTLTPQWEDEQYDSKRVRAEVVYCGTIPSHINEACYG